MSKQTAVSYLIETYQHSIHGLSLDDLEYALQLEKEQIEESFNAGDLCQSLYLDGESYYSQTYQR